MGMVKDEYIKWCERNDTNPIEAEMHQMDTDWQKEYEEWLDAMEVNDHA
jgi:hypothetical protein